MRRSPSAPSRRQHALPRVHAPELGDAPWWPGLLRDQLTGYLEAVSVHTGLFDAALPVLRRGLAAAPQHAVVDLGSGGGGPLPHLRTLLAREGVEARVLLTDRYPSAAARARTRGPGVQYLEQPVDALAVPAQLHGLRTLFNALHHFRPAAARALLADAQARGEPLASFEVVQRTPLRLLATLLIPLQVLLFSPLIRPRRALPLALTYLLPVVPLATWWDGLASTLRAYRREELEALVRALPTRSDYAWEVGVLRAGRKPPVLYVLGLPTARGAGAREGAP